jgi:hypothetical protein
MKLRSAFVFVGLASVIVSSGALIACSSESTSPAAAAASSGHTGKLSVALSSVGPDGATYSLEQGYIELDNAQGMFFSSGLYSNGSTVSYNVPTGAYTALISPTYPGGADAGNEWTLTRTQNGVSTPVVGFLADTLPYQVTILQNQTTSTIFHFTVPTIGDIAMSTGTWTTAIQVDGGTAAAGHVDEIGTFPFTSPETSTNAALNALFAPWDSPSIAASIQIALTSPFAASLDSACASGTLALTATASGDGVADANLLALWNGFDGSYATVCLDDNLNGNDGAVWVYLFQSGLPQTPAFASLASDGGSPYYGAYIQLTPPAPLYTGSVAELSQLALPTAMQIGLTEAYVSDGPATFFITGGGNSTTTATFQVTP